MHVHQAWASKSRARDSVRHVQKVRKAQRCGSGKLLLVPTCLIKNGSNCCRLFRIPFACAEIYSDYNVNDLDDLVFRLVYFLGLSSLLLHHTASRPTILVFGCVHYFYPHFLSMLRYVIILICLNSSFVPIAPPLFYFDTKFLDQKSFSALSCSAESHISLFEQG